MKVKEHSNDLIEIICDHCGEAGLKKRFRVNHNKKYDKKSFCSEKCMRLSRRLKIDVGAKYGLLTVIKELPKKGEQRMFLTECVCGKRVNSYLNNLRKRENSSCGCKRMEKIIERNKRDSWKIRKHGLGGTRLYRIYIAMLDRCSNPESASYARYGGRGISVCQQWQDDIMIFHEWAISNGYTDELTIDRIDNDGNYEPNNCRWATRIEQQNNNSRNRVLEINGELKTSAQWAREYDIDYSTFCSRLDAGDTGNRLIRKTKGKSKVLIELQRHSKSSKTIKEYLIEIGIGASCLYDRYRKGYRGGDLFLNKKDFSRNYKRRSSKKT